MELIQILAIFISLFAISRILLQIKNSRIALGSGIFWLLLWLSVIYFVVFPGLLGYMANITGVGRGVDLVIYLSILSLFYLIYRAYVKIDHTEREITKLVREIAIINRKDNIHKK